jgi:ectoine hydroxylase-related dioxygenase (phytanoyl-CoA dioxygenase family)
MLFSDVRPDDAPTRIRVGSHHEVATILEPAGEAGREMFEACGEIVPRTEHCPVVHATGEAGDVFLCHPFLVHAATWPHRGTTPRWIAQPALDPVEPYDLRGWGSR